ncbi:MAG: SRPBCC family protein [Opitutales bacterium]|jgi:ligand-binding SRPBCC domain-containing protein
MSKIHHFSREQTIATDLDTAWDFIRSPANLNKITPVDMSFQIVSELPNEMYNGLLIEYRVGIPLLGKQTWLTELKHIRDHRSFVDEQRIGPYKLWFHYHEITEVAAGVRFVDQVTYIMPFGPIGEIARAIYVKSQLKRIFDYRREAMMQHFANI